MIIKNEYEKLNAKIANTYANFSTANLKNHYMIRIYRLFDGQLIELEKGIIGFVTNGSFIDSQSTDGFRKVLYDEFNYLYIINLRGDQRTQGEKSRKEGGKIFGSGSRAPIAISILVKDGSYNHDIYYNDIGEYLTREQKLDTLMKHQSIVNLKSLNVLPDKNNDWINQRDINYENYLPMYDSKDIENSIYLDQFNGVNSARDNWVTNFSNEKALVNAKLLVDNYNSEIDRLIDILDSRERINLVNKDETFISWTRGLTQKFSKGKNISINPERIVKFMHRPFTKNG